MITLKVEADVVHTIRHLMITIQDTKTLSHQKDLAGRTLALAILDVVKTQLSDAGNIVYFCQPNRTKNTFLVFDTGSKEIATGWFDENHDIRLFTFDELMLSRLN